MWVDHAIWWHAYPLGFVGAPEQAQSQVQHRLPALVDWLDYLVELGASGLLLGPIFASSTHGYDTVDHFRIDARLGDEADFEVLVQAAHERGIRVLLDGVFNHVGDQFPRFQQVMAEGPTSQAAEWFHLYWPEYEHFEGHRDLVTLNHGSAQVRDYVTDVMCHWLDRGADGWRLDAAYAVPADFWAAVVPEVRQRHPQAYLVGEVIHGDYADYVVRSGLDSVTQYELWKSVWSSLNEANFFELDWTLQRHNGWLDTFVPLTFLGNHDVTRIASQLTDLRHYAHALVLLMTVGGTPSVYAGDEQGFQGVKRDQPGGDAEVRPPFPPFPSDLAPFGEGWFRLHQELIGLRRRHPWLHWARTETLHLTNTQLVYRTAFGDDALVVALNIGEHPMARPGGEVVAGDPDYELPAHGWVVVRG
jgi:cyclomaltodextrinase